MKNNKTKFKISFFDIAIFSVVIIAFLIAWCGFAPALTTSDNWDQLNQAYSSNYNNAHPIFHTFLMGSIAKIFNYVGAVAIFQIIVFALVWTWGCKVCRRDNDSKINKIVQLIITVIISILPINFVYAVTLWKDILFTYSMLAAVICIYIGIKNKYSFTFFEIIIISLSSVCIMKFRHNGVPIGFLIFVFLTIANFMKNRNIKSSCLFIGSFIVIYILTSIPSYMYLKKSTVESPAGALTSTELYCIGALLNTDIEFEQEDISFLNNILDTDEWKKCYDKYYGSDILFNENKNAEFLNDKDNVNKVREIFIKYTKKKPFVIIKHFIAVNSLWWSIPERCETNTIVINNDSVQQYDQFKYLNVDTKPISNKLNTVLNKYVGFTLNNKVVYTLIYRPAVGFYLSIAIVLCLIIKKKKFQYVYLLGPMILNIGTYIVIMSSQDARYFYTCNITVYFLLLVFFENYICKIKEKISFFLKEKFKKLDKKNKIKLVFMLLFFVCVAIIGLKYKLVYRYSLIYLTIINGAFFFSNIFKKKTGFTIPASILSIMIILYIFGLMHILKFGIYFVLIVYNVLGIKAIIKNKDIDQLLENNLTTGWLVFTIIFYWFMFVSYKRVFYVWDDIAIWSMASKNMFYLNDFITNANSTLVATYPPMPTILQYFVCKVLNRYSQGGELFASIILGMSLLIPIFDINNKRSFIKNIILFIIIIMIPTIFCEVTLYETIYVDSLLGIMIGYLIYSFVYEENQKYRVFNLLVIGVALALTKPTGIVILLIVAISFMFYLIINEYKNNKFSVKNILTSKEFKVIMALVLVSCFFFVTWKAYYAKNNANNLENVDNSSYVGNPIKYTIKIFIKSMLIGDANSDIEYEDLDSMNSVAEHIFEKKYYSTNPFNMSAGFWIIAFIISSVLIYKRITKDDKKRIFKNYTIATFIGLVLYILFLQVAYIIMFKGIEAVLHNSLQRYLGTYLIAILIYLVYSYNYYCDNNYIKGTTSNYLIIACLLAIATPMSIISNITFTANVYNQKHKKSLEEDERRADLIANVIDEDSNIYIVHQTGNSNTTGLRARYFLTPIKTNNSSVIDEKNDKDSIIKNMSEYKYVLVLNSDEYFDNNYSEIFENEIIKENTLYKVDMQNGIILHPVVLEK